MPAEMKEECLERDIRAVIEALSPQMQKLAAIRRHAFPEQVRDVVMAKELLSGALAHLRGLLL